MGYRQDSRSDKQFYQDIKDSTAIEQSLMALCVEDLNTRKKTGGYSFINHGVDNSGAPLPSHKVNTKADFILLCPGNKYKRIEIKFSRIESPTFHLKCNQLQSYIKQDCCIIMFMAVQTEDIRYCIIKPADMQDILDAAPQVYLWGKYQKKLFTKDFIWYKTRKLT